MQNYPDTDVLLEIYLNPGALFKSFMPKLQIDQKQCLIK